MKDCYGMIHPKPDVWKLVGEEIKASLVKKAPTHRSSFPWIGQNVLVARLHDYVIKGLEKCSPIGRSKPESEMKPFGFTIAINRAMYCRWELALLLAHWPSTDKARRKLIDEAFKRTDALLGHLADILDAAEPGSLRQFVWPTDIPSGNKDAALGPLKELVTVVAEAPPEAAEAPAGSTH
jgi:hypothetical protein